MSDSDSDEEEVNRNRSWFSCCFRVVLLHRHYHYHTSHHAHNYYYNNSLIYRQPPPPIPPRPKPKTLHIDTSKEAESMLFQPSNEDLTEADIQLIVKERDTQHIPMGDQEEPLIIRWTYENEVLAHNHLPYLLEEDT
jgi:hypothetical protein